MWRKLESWLVSIIVFKYFKSCQREEELVLFRMELVPKGVLIEVISFRIIIIKKTQNPSNLLKQFF